ncbi:hypothetical protein QIS99_02835 [Streptomyces sp. B-S-A8]|uniref:Uncharacterized protein n=1 Tax=Streptomyces solicavernae TaxID=3043614 RepID=A0ABT6RL51_9ACTN|nr:hypothetical protein [Streptomyces sp. B-S-A8]MDI3385158.1 hypothetical protein [Streptomyces sp. B-S-A8]
MRQRITDRYGDVPGLVGPFHIDRFGLMKEKEPVAPKGLRPEVFSEQRMTGGALRKMWAAGMQIFWSEKGNPSGPQEFGADPARRAEFRQKGKAFFGGWESTAGQLLAAVQPVSRWWYVWSFLALTPEGLRVYYAPSHQSSAFELAEGVLAGPAFPRERLAWIRRHKDGKHHEWGFTDGSWVTLHVADHEEFARQVPGVLEPKAPVPF